MLFARTQSSSYLEQRITVLLRKLSSSNTYFKKTQSLLLRLMLWVATRCLFVTVNQIILLVVYITQMQSLNWMPLLMLEPKLHVITIVAILNSRTPQPTESKTNNMPMSSALNFRRPFHSRMNTSLVDRSHSTKPQFMHFAIPDAVSIGISRSSHSLMVC
ncbi:hypothetical protein L208DRAFT_687242 [Tricholoma matsutake]|nr:hypothetical protein L208DRAFT_687242 [Tricholoma matsutake 945]